MRPQPIAESDDSQNPGIQQNGQTKLHVLYVWGAGQYITFLRVPVVIGCEQFLCFCCACSISIEICFLLANNGPKGVNGA